MHGKFKYKKKNASITLALDGVGGRAKPRLLYTRERPDTFYIGDCVGPTVSPEESGKFRPWD